MVEREGAVMITSEQLERFLPGSGMWTPHLNAAFARFGISTRDRVAAFLAQTAHESAGFKRLAENLNYSAEGLAATWPSRYRGADGRPNELALRLARKPEAIANNAYANRNGNGPEASGDGWRYRGRGLIQLTGRSNYRACGVALGLPFEAEPDLVAEPHHAAMASGWFWHTRGLNALADAAAFAAITRLVNGGMNGHDDRIRYWQKALKALEA